MRQILMTLVSAGPILAIVASIGVADEPNPGQLRAKAERLQREYRVSIAGPTTLAALLNSLQMGFRTLAIQERSSEVWKLLGSVKTQFGQFSGLLAKVEQKLEEASSTIGDASKKSRTIERRLGKVQELPSGQ